MPDVGVYLACLGLGALGLGLGLVVGGPIGLDRRWERTRSDSAWVTGEDALDLHADRPLGQLQGRADELWLPLATLHCWTVALAVCGLAGLVAAWLVGFGAARWVAPLAGIAAGYLAGRAFRTLPRAGS